MVKLRSRAVLVVTALGLLAVVAVLVRVRAGTAASSPQKKLEARVRGGKATPAEMVELGERYLVEDQPLKAAELAFQARKADPKLATAPNLLGVVYARLNEPAKARGYFEESLRLAPDQLSPLLNLVRLDMDAQDPVAALARLKAAQVTHDKDPTLWLLTGQAERHRGRNAAAYAAFRRAVELDPAQGEAWAEIGTLHMAFDRPTLAVEPLEKAYAAGDRRPETLCFLALALTTAQARPADVERAGKLLEEAGDQKNRFGLLAQAIVQKHRGDLAGARQTLERVLREDPRYERALFVLAETYRAEGNREASVKAMRQFQQMVVERQRILSLAGRISKEKPHPALLRDYGKALLAAGRVEEARQQFRAWHALAPNDPEPAQWLRKAAGLPEKSTPP